jgi:hypothetical protein
LAVAVVAAPKVVAVVLLHLPIDMAQAEQHLQ